MRLALYHWRWNCSSASRVRSVRSVSADPVPNLWYGWEGVDVVLSSWYMRHMSLLMFLECSESTASSSRSVPDSVNNGAMKNWENMSSVSFKCGAWTPKW